MTGLGANTLKVLRDLQVGAHCALSGWSGEYAAGNGAAMRIAPLAFFINPETDRMLIRDVCNITHKNDEAYVGSLAIFYSLHYILTAKWLPGISLVELDSAFIKQQRALMPEPQRLQEVFSSVGDFYNNHLLVDSALLATIKCPVLVMAGDHDPFNRNQQVVNAAKMSPNSNLAIITNASHAAFADNFPAVWTCILPFLKK